MAMLPQSNARLLAVTRGGFSEDYDSPAGSAAPVWQGNVDAYVSQKIRAVFNPRAGLERVVDITLIISGDIAIKLESGDTVTYLPSGGSTSSGRIQNIITPAQLPGLPEYYKCSLEETNVPEGL